MKIYHIYKITNVINNKIYIGQTSQVKFYERFNRHLSNARCNLEGFLYNAIRKYGHENFNFELIYCCLDQTICNELEIHFINQFQSTNKKFGYNILIGGGQSPLPLESRQKISKVLKQQYLNGRKPWNADLKGTYHTGLKPWNSGMKGQYKLDSGVNISKALTGVSKSEEHRKNLSIAKKKYNAENTHVQAKKVRCIETEMIFDSATKAAQFFGTNNHSNITRVCRGERKHYKQLTFEYVK